MAQNEVVLDGELSLNIPLDGEANINLQMDGESGAVIKIDRPIEPLVATENGEYNAGDGGYNPVIVQVPPWSDELYPVGTDIVSMYLGRNLSNGDGFFVHGTINYTTGEFTQTDVETDSGICLTYIPINPSYTYYKTSSGRFYRPCYYDENYEYIGRGTEHNNLSFQQIMDEMPENTKYMRFCTHPNTNNWDIAIYRMA